MYITCGFTSAADSPIAAASNIPTGISEIVLHKIKSFRATIFIVEITLIDKVCKFDISESLSSMHLPFILFSQEVIMPRGDKSAYTDKQKRQVAHIEEGYKKRGISSDEAARRAWATENKISGGGRKSGAGRAHKS